MKEQKGISRVAIIIDVVIGLVIVAIGGYLILANGSAKKNTTPTPETEQGQEVITEITAKEKTEIKEYLKKFAYVAIMGETESTQTHETMSQDVAMIYMATENIDVTYSTIQDTNANTSNTNTTTLNESSATNTVEDDRITMNIGNTTQSNTTATESNTLSNTTSSNLTTTTNTQTQNPFGISETEIQNAVFEMFGQKLDNLSQILSEVSTEHEISEVNITQMQDIAKSNDIYTALFNVCILTKEQKQAGININGLNSYTIQAKFEKNDNPKYSEYKLSSINITTKTVPTAYHESYVNEKCGVIDNNGIVVLEAKYKKIEIPNSYIGLFICYTDDNSKPTILNEKGIEQFTDYDSATLITATGENGITWNENNVMIVEKDGYYGVTDFKGNIIYDVEYEEIKPLGYQVNRLVLTKNGKQALADTEGNFISGFEYSKIGILGVDFETSAMVTSTRTEEQVLALMQTNDYTLGLSSTGTYYILETEGVNEEEPIMNTFANSYDLTLGTSWQLVALATDTPKNNTITLTTGQVITLENQKPVYTKQLESQTATE